MAQLGSFIGSKIDALGALLGAKLDTEASVGRAIAESANATTVAVGVNTQAAYQNALSIKYGVDALDTNTVAGLGKVVDAIHGIAGGVPGGSATDMAPTNALLTSIKANTENGTLSGGDSCAGAMPSMTGLNVTESYIAAESWKTHCALENEFKDSGNGKHGDLDDASTSDGFIQASADGSGGTGSSGLDDSGFGWGRSCPASEHVAVMGHDFVIDSSMLCTAMRAISVMVLLVGAIVSVRILATA